MLASAKSIIKCGNEEISWPLFRRASICLDAKAKLSKDIYGAIVGVDMIIQTSKEISLSLIFYQQQNRECTDSRDKVYGYMNLLDPAVERRIVVDYFEIFSGCV